MSSPRHFLTLMDLTPKELGYLIQRAVELKTMLHTGQFHEPYIPGAEHRQRR